MKSLNLFRSDKLLSSFRSDEIIERVQVKWNRLINSHQIKLLSFVNILISLIVVIRLIDGIYLIIVIFLIILIVLIGIHLSIQIVFMITTYKDWTFCSSQSQDVYVSYITTRLEKDGSSFLSRGFGGIWRSTALLKEIKIFCMSNLCIWFTFPEEIKVFYICFFKVISRQ
jgi:hypothetical protein